MRGLPIPAESMPVTATKNRKKLPNDQLDSTARCAISFINQYAYRLDEQFLRKKARPVMLACAYFDEISVIVD